MKKFLSILLCMVMALTLLAGCGKGDKGTDPTETTKHSHTYASEWSSDETNHWYEATCEHTGLKVNFGEHMDEDLDGLCDVCGYEDQNHKHEFSEDWSTDADYHWHAATCTHIGAVSEKGEHADEDNDGACDVCAYMGDHTHSYEQEWTYDENQHWHEAACDHDVVDEKVDHEDKNNDGECDVCGWFDASHTHTFSDDWKMDVTYHWHGATCEHLGAVSGREQHVDGDENGYCDTCNYLMCQHIDFDLDGECDTCGGPLDPDHVHEYGSETGYDTTGHWFIATCHPGAVSEKVPHEDPNNDGVCNGCGFQLCGHSYAAAWTNNDTHHWHAILCTCSIERKDYAQHVDADGDGGCDVCMYGLPVPSVYETVVDYEPYMMIMDSMITYSPVTINFPQAGRYVITPHTPEGVDVRVWETNNGDFFNSEGPLTVEVTEAGDMTLYFRYFDFGYYEGKEVFFAYSVVRMDDLELNTMQGKVELPANTLYIVKFFAPEVGVYKLFTSVDGIDIGLTEDTMEYFKGHMEMHVTEPGQEFQFFIRYRDLNVTSFIFDWRLDPPFSLNVGEGNFAVDVGAKQFDYKIEFTAPTDGYFLLKVHNEWLTFAQMGDVYIEPVRLETMEVLTHFMQAGEVYTIYLQPVYDYPESTNIYDTLSITNVGEKLSIGSHTVAPGAEGTRYCFTASSSAYYRIEVTNGELGIVASNGTISWTTAPYEVELKIGQTYSYLVRGAGDVTVKTSSHTYNTELNEGENTVTLEPNKHYTVNFAGIDINSYVALSWEGSLDVRVNGVEYTQGATIELLSSEVTVLVKGNGATEVKITVTMVEGGGDDITIEGDSDATLMLHTYVKVAVHRDGTGALARFTAEIGGTYTLTSGSENATVSIQYANGTREQIIVGMDTYSFNLDVGEEIVFYIETVDEEPDSIPLMLTPGN